MSTLKDKFKALDNLNKFIELFFIIISVVLFTAMSLLLKKESFFTTSESIKSIFGFVLLQSMIIYRVYFKKE